MLKFAWEYHCFVSLSVIIIIFIIYFFCYHDKQYWNECDINAFGWYKELSSKGATQLVKLAHRISLQFYSSNTGSPVRKWVTYHAENVGPNIRFMTRKNVNVLGEHTGVVLSAATCVWLPVHHQTLFNFLSDTRQRNRWDILTKTSSVETLILIQKANCQSNSVSLIHILVSLQIKDRLFFSLIYFLGWICMWVFGETGEWYKSCARVLEWCIGCILGVRTGGKRSNGGGPAER